MNRSRRLILFITQAAAMVPAPAAPVNSVPPAVTGTPEGGQTLSVSNGSWLNLPTSYTYQWFTVDPLLDGGVLVTHNGEPVWVGAKSLLGTAATQLITGGAGGEAGKLIGCDVTAINDLGSGVAESNVLGPVP